MSDAYYTVEEASRFLTCAQPLPLPVLSKLGRDCSFVCRVRGETWQVRDTPDKPWPSERAYSVNVIREVFKLNPDTAPYLP